MFASSLCSMMLLFVTLQPTKTWYTPDQPILIDVKPDAPVRLVMTEFGGVIHPTKPEIDNAEQVDLKKRFDGLKPNTYVLYAVPKSVAPDANPSTNFVGTPLVVQIRQDKRAGAQSGPLVVRVEPMRYVTMETSQGELTMAFYYDVAPNTVSSFLTLAAEGYFDGQVFHRIIPNFVIQGGDPLGGDPKRAGTGGPGFMIDAEFNDRPHEKGVLSMARQGDPLEQQGMPPRSEAANSASSQFFICLDYNRTKALDGKYTVFGKVVGALTTVDKLAAVPTGAGDRPTDPPVIKKATVSLVTPQNNPYAQLITPVEAK